MLVPVLAKVTRFDLLPSGGGYEGLVRRSGDDILFFLPALYVTLRDRDVLGGRLLHSLRWSIMRASAGCSHAGRAAK
jgi:hypothetical protein